MLEYRVYVLDRDRSIRSKFDFLCSDDSSAARKVESLLEGHALELWEGTRRIGTFEPSRDKATGARGAAPQTTSAQA